VAKNILQHGVTSFCPTVVTSKPATYKKVVNNDDGGGCDDGDGDGSNTEVCC